MSDEINKEGYTYDFNMDKAEMMIALKDAYNALEKDVFEGVVVAAVGNKVRLFTNNGTVDHRVQVIDSMFHTMIEQANKGEPNVTALEVFMIKMYHRFVYYFAEPYEAFKKGELVMEMPPKFEDTNR